MKKAILLILVGVLFVVSGVLSEEKRRLITSDEFVEKLSRSPDREAPGFSLRGIKIYEEKQPAVTAHILFKFGSTEIADQFSKQQLDEAGKALSSMALTNYRFEIAGHTDSIGSEEYNLKLSEQRASAIKKYLTEMYRIPKERLKSKGYGESTPVASNDAENGRLKNRRVVFKRLD